MKSAECWKTEIMTTSADGSNPTNPELIGAELKRCADELASCDISMQVLRKKIQRERQEPPEKL